MLCKRHQGEALDLDREIHALTEQRKGLPTHVRVVDLPEHQRPEALPVAERLFLDIIRMIAYRAETRMMPALIGVQGKKTQRAKNCSVPCSPATRTSFQTPTPAFSACAFSGSQAKPANACSPLSSTNSTTHAPSTPEPSSRWSMKCPQKQPQTEITQLGRCQEV